MTLDEYNEKYKNQKKLHPAPEGMKWPESTKWRRQFVLKWQSQLSEEDRTKVIASEHSFHKKMSFSS